MQVTSDQRDIPDSMQEVIRTSEEFFTGIAKFNNTEMNFKINEQVKPAVQKECFLSLPY